MKQFTANRLTIVGARQQQLQQLRQVTAQAAAAERPPGGASTRCRCRSPPARSRPEAVGQRKLDNTAVSQRERRAIAQQVKMARDKRAAQLRREDSW